MSTERTEKKTIVLIDLLTGGHRTAFMRLFAESCLQLNCSVICLYPKIEDVINSFRASCTQIPESIIFVPYDPIISCYHNFGRFNDAVNTIAYWKQCGKILNQLETEHAVKIDLVFFNWLDSQMANYLPSFLVDIVFPYNWSGLYFHPRIFRIKPEFLETKISFRDVDSVFLSKRCIAVTLHDEGILDTYQKHLGKKTILFPEIADDTEPDPENALAKAIKAKAKGRIIIGLIGLEPYKGALSLIRLAKHADASKFFFAFTGYYTNNFLNALSEDERKEYNLFVQQLPENCIWHTGRLKEGAEYNAVFCSFDIIHIVYKDFYSSSNRLTKAAIFGKLVLANNYGCVGDDVPKYDLGETTDEDNVEEQNQKIELLRERILHNRLPVQNWKIYAEKHSTESLKEKFEEILNLV